MEDHTSGARMLSFCFWYSLALIGLVVAIF